MTISSNIPRTALVTGAAKRIGRSLSLELARLGFAVAIHYGNSKTEASALAQEITQSGGKAAIFGANLAQESQVRALFDDAQVQLGPIGVVVNNASLFEQDDALSTDRTLWDRHMEINLRAPFVLSQCLASNLASDAEGVVVNLLDQRVWNLTPYFTSYTLSKAGLWSLTQSLALALAPCIRVAGIGPGPALASVRQTAESFAQQCASTPLGRGTSLAELTSALRFILESPSFTGQMIALDGGQHLNWGDKSTAIDE